ncbi:spermatogenesis-associated protein 16-like [Leucoraja erinacea]|uniref:spermatogenesis-associated protein 16-like n=1 Tax=Leucoraja erinaceus TaxID=7782 RepID=UPI002458FDE6|nr:spermatogenesis-associated protein 16-like [Leucoraja erinacea]
MASTNLKSSDGKQNVVLNTKISKESDAITVSQNSALENAEDPRLSNGNDKVCNRKPESYLNQRITHTRKVKLKRKNTLDSLGIKRKLENEEKFTSKKELKIVEHQDPPVIQSLSRVPLKSVMDVEMKLVYVDEQQIMYEFVESQEYRSAESTCEVTKSGESTNSCALNLAPQMDKWLAKALKDASFYYHQKKYSVAAGRFRTALELCSKGAVLGNPFYASYEKISSIASFIETKLVTCYLRMRRPDLALNHAHRSILLNPINFRNHLRQATVFRCLERYAEAARSAMIADYIYWLHGAKEQNISKHVKLYWQAMLEEGITQAETFSVMYTPFAVNPTTAQIEKIKEVFRNKHPSYANYLYADPGTNHILPQTVDWSEALTQRYMLLLGFKNPEDGTFLEKIINRRSPTFTESRTPFWSLTVKEVEKNMDILGRRILPVLDFTLCTKLAGGICPGTGVFEKLQYASYLSQLKRMKEQAQVINQTIAELATMPYLHEMSQHEIELLHSLMTDAVDTLEGNKTSGECVWSKTEKVGLIEDLIYQLEDNFLKSKALKTARKQRREVKKLKSQKLVPLPSDLKQTRETKSVGKTAIHSQTEK